MVGGYVCASIYCMCLYMCVLLPVLWSVCASDYKEGGIIIICVLCVCVCMCVCVE